MSSPCVHKIPAYRASAFSSSLRLLPLRGLPLLSTTRGERALIHGGTSRDGVRCACYDSQKGNQLPDTRVGGISQMELDARLKINE